MSNIQLNTDETRAEKEAFYITTTIWGQPKDCRDYEKAIAEIISINKKLLGKDFKIFHANKLNNKNWAKLSIPYIQVINKLFSFIKTDALKILIFIESNKKYSSNTVFLKETLQSHLLDRRSRFGQIYKYLKEKDLIPFYFRAGNIYNYLRNRDIFGGAYQDFEYYPDSSGKILQYKHRKCFIESPNFPGVPILENYFDAIRMITNGLANAINKVAVSPDSSQWKKPVGQKLVVFEPMADDDSYLIQTADIISNLFLNLIKYLIGMRADIMRKKALVLLGFDAFRRNKKNIEKEFLIRNGNSECKNKDFEARLTVEREFHRNIVFL